MGSEEQGLASQSQPSADAQERSHDPQQAVEWDAAPTGVTLWGVYGPDCFPTIFACRLRDYFWHGRAIWGYSIYEGEPGFRTLGAPKKWADENRLRLFRSRSAAFDHIASLLSDEVCGLCGELLVTGPWGVTDCPACNPGPERAQ